MAEIIPAVLEKTYAGLVEKLEKVLGLVDTIQLDVCDGVFVPTVSWPYTAPMIAGGPNHYDENMKEIISGNGEIQFVRDTRTVLCGHRAIGDDRLLIHRD